MSAKHECGNCGEENRPLFICKICGADYCADCIKSGWCGSNIKDRKHERISAKKYAAYCAKISAEYLKQSKA